MSKNRFFSDSNSSSSNETTDSDEEKLPHADKRREEIESDDTDIQRTQPYEQFLKDKTIAKENPIDTKRKPPSSVRIQISSNDIQKTKQVDTDLKMEEIVLRKLNEIIPKRGKYGVNHEEQVNDLQLLREQIDIEDFHVEMKIQILFTQITFSFDYYHQCKDYTKSNMWTHALEYIEELLMFLSEHNQDDMIAIILRMDTEFTKILQNIDPHSQEYVEWLKDEIRICSIIDRFKNYLESNSNSTLQNLCTIYLRVIEHNYYRTFDQSMEQLWKFIYYNNTLDHIRDRANLCYIYHLALHDHYHDARNLMLMCHLQDRIHLFDIATQILYNRTIVQLGLCAFRFGAIHEAHQILVDIQSGNHLKDLLGQDKQREYSLPYHMHINLQLIECIYLISSMLIEIPTTRKHRISKQFHIVMSQIVHGPPETMREHVIAATHALNIGDWKACINFLMNDKMNTKVWNLMPKATVVCEMLINKIKEESLRIYLLNNSTVFDTISISTLVDMFQLSMKQVHSILCKMITSQELMGLIDESNQMVIMHKIESIKIQGLSNELMDKVFTLHKCNERLSHFH